MNGNNEGPQTRTIPQQQETVCNGCKHLEVEPMMYGHKSVTKNYTCLHADMTKERLWSNGKLIHWNHEGSCITPGWCPFLKPKQNEKEGHTTES